MDVEKNPGEIGFSLERVPGGVVCHAAPEVGGVTEQLARQQLTVLGYLEDAGELPEGDLSALVLLYRAEGAHDPDDAVRQFRALIEKYPKFWRAYDGLSLALARQGKAFEAFEVLETPGLPESPGLWERKAKLLYAMPGSTDHLGVALYAGKLRDAGWLSGWQLGCQVLRDEGDAPALQAMALEGLARFPEDPQLLLALALAEVAQKDRHGFETLDRVEALQGEWVGPARLQRALLWEKLGEIARADKEYARYRQVAPEDIRAWAAPAWMLYQAGNCVDSLPLALEALKIDPKEGRMRLVRSMCE